MLDFRDGRKRKGKGAIEGENEFQIQKRGKGNEPFLGEDRGGKVSWGGISSPPIFFT